MPRSRPPTTTRCRPAPPASSPCRSRARGSSRWRPALAAAAFYPAAPLPQPVTATDTAWARLTNIAGLVAGQSKLGDELALLYTWDAIAASAFGPMLEWRWDGTAFTATP